MIGGRFAGPRSVGLYALGAVAAASAGISASLLSVQFSILLLVLLAVVLMRPTQMVFGAVLMVALVGLLRRLLAGPSGRIDNDPLALLPVIFVLAALMLTPRRTAGKSMPDAINVSLLILAVTPWVSTAVAGRFEVDTIFSVVLQSSVWVLVASIRNGGLPDVWPEVARWLPVMGAITALYGLFQFVALPDWDRVWMISSNLHSIGHASAGEVRVFGTAESPGPFAAFIGVCAVATGARLLNESRPARVVLLLLATMVMLVTLFLTGVRTALLALVAATVLIALVGRGFGRIAIPALLAVGTVTVTVLGLRFAGSRTSNVLVEDRYIGISPESDDSLQARLGLLAEIRPSLAHPLGQGVGTNPATGAAQSLDNAFIDVLVSFGPLALGALIVVLGTALAKPLSARRRGEMDVVTGAAMVFLAVFTLAGNVFASNTGILAALVLGSTLRGPATTDPDIPRGSPGVNAGCGTRR